MNFAAKRQQVAAKTKEKKKAIQVGPNRLKMGKSKRLRQYEI